jgi:hypothetical protein
MNCRVQKNYKANCVLQTSKTKIDIFRISLFDSFLYLNSMLIRMAKQFETIVGKLEKQISSAAPAETQNIDITRINPSIQT